MARQSAPGSTIRLFNIGKDPDGYRIELIERS